MEFTLNVTAGRSVARESLKGIIWAIFFNRLFGPIMPTTGEFLDIPYPMAEGLPDLDMLIDQKIDQLIKKDFLSMEDSSVGQLVIAFLHKELAKKKKMGWFGHSKEEGSPALARWETWIINVNCLPKSPEIPLLASPTPSNVMNTAEQLLHLSALSFEDTLNEILTLVNRHKEHIPPIMTLDVSPFPYEIEIDPFTTTRQTPDDDTWAQYIKKLLD